MDEEDVKPACLENSGDAEQPRHNAALGKLNESVPPAAGVLQTSLAFPCGSGSSHPMQGEGLGETLQLKVPFVICLILPSGPEAATTGSAKKANESGHSKENP